MRMGWYVGAKRTNSQEHLPWGGHWTVFHVDMYCIPHNAKRYVLVTSFDA